MNYKRTKIKYKEGEQKISWKIKRSRIAYRVLRSCVESTKYTVNASGNDKCSFPPIRLALSSSLVNLFVFLSSFFALLSSHLSLSQFVFFSLSSLNYERRETVKDTGNQNRKGIERNQVNPVCFPYRHTRSLSLSLTSFRFSSRSSSLVKRYRRF